MARDFRIVANSNTVLRFCDLLLAKRLLIDQNLRVFYYGGCKLSIFEPPCSNEPHLHMNCFRVSNTGCNLVRDDALEPPESVDVASECPECPDMGEIGQE